MKHNVGVTVDSSPPRQVVQEFDCRRPGSQQSPLNLMLLYQLLQTARLAVQIQRLDISTQEAVAKKVCSAVNEGRYAGKDEVAAELVAIETAARHAARLQRG